MDLSAADARVLWIDQISRADTDDAGIHQIFISIGAAIGSISVGGVIHYEEGRALGVDSRTIIASSKDIVIDVFIEGVTEVANVILTSRGRVGKFSTLRPVLC